MIPFYAIDSSKEASMVNMAEQMRYTVEWLNNSSLASFLPYGKDKVIIKRRVKF